MYVKGKVSIGSRFRCFPGLRLEVFKNAQVSIGDNVAMGQNIHITCGKKIEIKSGVCIAASVCITDVVHTYNQRDRNILECEDTYSETYIGENSFIGYGAVIDAGSRLGRGCVVGANAYVKGIFPDYSVVAGNPAKQIKVY